MPESTEKKVISWLLAALILLGCVTLLVLANFLNSKNAKTIDQRTAYFSGMGKVYVKPDTAEATFGVVNQGTEAKDVVATNNKSMEKIIAYLKSNGIKEEDIQTVNYSLYPQYDWNYCNAQGESKTCIPKILSYEVNQQATFKSKDFAKMADLLGGLAEQGANNISSLTFTIEDPEQYRSEAREKAVQQAGEKAKNLAQSAGVTLGRIISVSEDYSLPPVFSKGFEGYGGAAGSGAPIQSGNQEIVVTVNVGYELK